MTWTQGALLLGMVSLAFPVFAIAARHASRLLLVAGLGVALSFCAFFGALFQALGHVGPEAVPWLRIVVGSGVPIALSGIALTACLGRQEPWQILVGQRRLLLLMTAAGIGFLALLGRTSVIHGYDLRSSSPHLLLGPLGKAYLGYLLVGIVASGYNLERTYRDAVDSRVRLRIPFFGFLCVLGYFVYFLTSSLLYASVAVNTLVAAALPVVVGSALVGYGFLRGGLSDTAVPVSRKLVYSSLTVLAASFYILAVGIVAQIAVYLHWSPGDVITISLCFLFTASVALFLFSNRVQRRVRRFIDLNFYANRYDYRSQWSLLTEHLSSRRSTEEILEAARYILTSVFQPEELTLATRDKTGDGLRPRVGKGVGESLLLRKGEPLFERCRGGGKAILFSERPDDFELIPICAENAEWLEGTASHVVAPLLAGQEMVGMVGLGRHTDGSGFTFEELDLLDRMTAHVAAALHNAALTEELAEAREMELLSQWSSFLLHDLKNHLSPLRMIEVNLKKHGDNPAFRHVAQTDLAHMRERMENLIQRLCELREGPLLERETIHVDQLIRQIVSEYKLYEREDVEVTLDLRARAHVVGDRTMLHRVVVNLITNALESMPQGGALRVETKEARDGRVEITVTDSGVGMTEEFLRDRLFRPFATSKRRGLGLGLYQSRSIIRATGGEIHVESRLGQGSSFRVVLPAAAVEAEVQVRTAPALVNALSRNGR